MDDGNDLLRFCCVDELTTNADAKIRGKDGNDDDDAVADKEEKGVTIFPKKKTKDDDEAIMATKTTTATLARMVEVAAARAVALTNSPTKEVEAVEAVVVPATVADAAACGGDGDSNDDAKFMELDRGID